MPCVAQFPQGRFSMPFEKATQLLKTPTAPLAQRVHGCDCCSPLVWIAEATIVYSLTGYDRHVILSRNFRPLFAAKSRRRSIWRNGCGQVWYIRPVVEFGVFILVPNSITIASVKAVTSAHGVAMMTACSRSFWSKEERHQVKISIFVKVGYDLQTS